MKPESSLIIFNFDGSHPVRVAEGRFIAADVATILNIKNIRQNLANLDEDEKGVCLISTSGGPQNMAFVTESGLNALILRCDDAIKPGTPAHRFRKWVTSEVLPQIRKTGGYQTPQTFAQALRAYADQVEENEKLRLAVQEQAPAVDFVQRYVKAEGLFGIRETAKILELKQNFFVTMCIEKKVLFRENGTLQAYAEWIEKGYFEVKVGEVNEHAFKQTRFTSKGLEWVRRYLDIPGLLAMAS